MTTTTTIPYGPVQGHARRCSCVRCTLGRMLPMRYLGRTDQEMHDTLDTFVPVPEGYENLGVIDEVIELLTDPDYSDHAYIARLNGVWVMLPMRVIDLDMFTDDAVEACRRWAEDWRDWS